MTAVPGKPDAEVLRRTETRVSNWVGLVAKEVRFGDALPEVYHCFAQADYVAVLAQTRDGQIPLVRQFRPAVGSYTWELPAGLVDAGEDAERACRRELREEAGLEVESLVPLGVCYADTGRLENRIHNFFVRASIARDAFVPEPGVTVDLVSLRQLHEMIRTGAFCHQLHVALLASARIHGIELIG